MLFYRPRYSITTKVFWVITTKARNKQESFSYPALVGHLKVNGATVLLGSSRPGMPQSGLRIFTTSRNEPHLVSCYCAIIQHGFFAHLTRYLNYQSQILRYVLTVWDHQRHLRWKYLTWDWRDRTTSVHLSSHPYLSYLLSDSSMHGDH